MKSREIEQKRREILHMPSGDERKRLWKELANASSKRAPSLEYSHS